MSKHARTSSELRCWCRDKVLLAHYGIDTDGEAYLHIKARKGSRVITNSLHKGGQHDLQCTHCMRFTRIYLTPRGSRIIPPSRNLPELLSGDGSITLPDRAPQK